MDAETVATDKRIETPCGRVWQVAALVYKSDTPEPQILLITSRGTGRWVLPKGWPQVGKTLPQSALREAYEEAGVRGVVSDAPIGTYTYEKTDAEAGEDRDFLVNVYPVRFTHSEKDWPERRQRRLIWVSPKEAARRVDEADLKSLLAAFNPAGTAL